MLPFGNGAERLLQDRVTGRRLASPRLQPAHPRPSVESGAGRHRLRTASRLGRHAESRSGVPGNPCRGCQPVPQPPLLQRVCHAHRHPPGTVRHERCPGRRARRRPWGGYVPATTAEALRSLQPVRVIEPEAGAFPEYREAYERWCSALRRAGSRIVSHNLIPHKDASRLQFSDLPAPCGNRPATIDRRSVRPVAARPFTQK